MIAVLTGDLIKSRQVSTLNYDRILLTLEQTFHYLNDKETGEVQLQDGPLTSKGIKFEIYRGDSFQAVFYQINHVMLAALIIRLALIADGVEYASHDARISIGIGSYDQVRDNIGSSTGEAFTLSGLGLDNLKNQHLAIFSSNQEFQSRINLLTKFIDVQINQLTAKQASVLLAYLTTEDKSHHAIADTFNTSRENITQQLKKSNYQLFAEYLALFDVLSTDYFSGSQNSENSA